MPDKILPTRGTDIAVRPESIPTPEGKTERREFRTVNSKTFLHAEKAADGKEIRTCQATIGAVCYSDDNGELRSIDTTIRDLGDRIGVEWAPYKFDLHESGIGFDFFSRDGGWVGVTLSGIGGEKFDQDTPLTPDITDNVITFRDVRPGCDIVFTCLNSRVKTLRILRDANAPRIFDWTVVSDKPELIDSTLIGTDAAGNQLELSSEVDGNVIRETWNGSALDKVVVYPVEIDPSVTVTPVTSSGDDGCDVAGSWFNNLIELGRDSGNLVNPGFRFPGVTVPQGATIDSSTLTLKTWFIAGQGTGGQGDMYGVASDNAAAFSSSNLPSNASRTTATVSVSISAAANQTLNYTTTSIVQEIVSRGGFASNNAIAMVIVSTSTGTNNYCNICDLDTDAAKVASLSITYTAAAGGTAGNLLLLGCG